MSLSATFQTSQGPIHVRLFDDKAPLTVANFVNLAQRGYYDGLNFHRVIAERRDRGPARHRSAVLFRIHEALGDQLGAQRREIVAVRAHRDVSAARAQRGVLAGHAVSDVRLRDAARRCLLEDRETRAEARGVTGLRGVLGRDDGGALRGDPLSLAGGRGPHRKGQRDGGHRQDG